MSKKSQIRFVAGAVGQIESRWTEPTDNLNKWVVLCHPHPQFGGTMDNKVVTTVERAFQALGFGTVAFQFRGVGQSEGEYDGGKGEQDDLVAVVSTLKESFTVDEFVLAGFSFGSYIALKQANVLQPDKMITIAPPVNLYDFSSIKVAKSIAWRVIQGGEDEVVPALEVFDWVSTQENKADIYWRGEASHFFHRQLVWLKKIISLA